MQRLDTPRLPVPLTWCTVASRHDGAMTRRLSDTTATLTGLALILLPIVALLVKLASLGWMVFALFITAPLWLVGYGVQVAVAISGYFSARAVLREGPVATRALVYSWATSVAVVLVGLFLVDGGDTDEWGSTFMLWTGLASDSAASTVSTAVCNLALLVWVVCWVCLVTEWIAALVRRRRARRAGDAAASAAEQRSAVDSPTGAARSES